MLQKRNDVPLLAMASNSRRRYSEATEIFDTDFEADYSDEDSPRRSDELFGYDSSTTLSTPDIATPDNTSLGIFNFQIDEKPVEGPTGPHLFRSSIASSLYAKSTEIDLYLERSPVQTRFPPSVTDLPKSTPSLKRSTSSRKSKSGTKVQPDSPRLDDSQVRTWSPAQVADWMSRANLDEEIIDKFIVNDISGQVLLTLQIEDLKELDIQSFGKRHQVMSAIQSLRDTMSSPVESKTRREKRSGGSCSPEVSVSPTGEVLTHRNQGRRGRDESVISPAESVSIVGIEQVLPKLHKCSKGENCSKYKKQQRQLALLAAEYPGERLPKGGTIVSGNPGNPDTAKNLLRPTSEAEPSVVASSDVLGPAQQPKLCEEALNGVMPRDPQESIRQFLSYQHLGLQNSKPIPEIVTTTVTSVPFTQLSPTQSPNIAANLRSLPKLTIPAEPESDMLTSAQRTITPSMATRRAITPTGRQEFTPFAYGQYVSPADFYRQGTPFSEMDVPVTAIPIGPIARETSQSVPPDMRFGNAHYPHQDPIARPFSARARPAATPLSRVEEGRILTPIDAPSDMVRNTRQVSHTPSHSESSINTDPDVTRCGWMKKRKTTRFLRHEWQDAHFTLKGTNLAMHRDENDARRNSKALESIDVDDFAVACSSLATSSKLTAAFKRSVLRRAMNAGAGAGNNFIGNGSDDAAFAFSLIPASKETEKKALFASNGKSHHFSVKTRDERIDWMRELMLAKALKKGKESGGEVRVNGNII